MAKEKQKKSCVEVAVGLIGRRDYSMTEMRQKLTQKDYPEEEIETAISRLEELGYLDDGKYARHFVNDKGRLSGWGRKRIVMTLQQKQVNDDAINEALEAYEEKMANEEVPTWESSATELLERKYGSFTGRLEAKELQKRMNFLLRRGFDIEQARKALENTRQPDV